MRRDTHGQARSVTPVSEPVADGLFADEGLIGGLCGRCGRKHFPLAGTCPWCGGNAVTTVTLSGRGTLWAWTAVTAAPAGYDGDVPYGFGVVELAADGLRVISRLTESDPARLAAGAAMQFVVVDLPTSRSTWAFAPVRA
jgi:uncharacterized OB-fold protein